MSDCTVLFCFCSHDGVVPYQGEPARDEFHVIEDTVTLFSDSDNDKLLENIHGLIRDAGVQLSSRYRQHLTLESGNGLCE
jgi:hypothetical protein